jgi:predicted lipoprotein with Yx(FWY)xxD motif
MTEKQEMTRLTTVRSAGRAAREHAGWTAPGWPAVILRVAGSGLLIATAAIHLDLYLTGYRTIPTIGWLFLLQVIVAFGLGLAVLAIPSRLAIASRLAAAAGAGFALATLGGYLLSVWTGLFGFKEVRTTAGIVAGVVEVIAFVVLAALALAPAPADGTAAAPARFPAQIPPAAARAAGMTAAGLAVAALVLFGLVVAGASSPAPAATATGTGTVLKTTTIGGTTVLTNAKGFTLYSFAPDTPNASKCYGSCAVYWPPVTGTAAAGQGLPGKVTTITRTDGSHQLTYNGHPLYTYIETPLPARPGATTSTSTAASGTTCLPPGKENHRWLHRAPCGSPAGCPAGEPDQRRGLWSSDTPSVLTAVSIPISGSRSAPTPARPARRQPRPSLSARPVRYAATA